LLSTPIFTMPHQFRRGAIPFLLASSLALGTPRNASGQILDRRAVLARQSWWDNRDWDWYAARIPFFESPDFGAERIVEQVKLYFLDDGEGSSVRAPASYTLQTWNGHSWADAGIQRREASEPAGHRANVIALAPRKASRVRVVLEPRRGAALGMTEMEVWGHNQLPLAVPTAPSHDLAFN
jgi:hypothetical protein